MDHLIVARVRRPHGVKGELLVTVETDRPRRVFTPGASILLGDEEGRPTGRGVVVQHMRPATGGAILKLRGIDDRDRAGELRGRTLLIEAAAAAPASPDEVHYRDLVGLRAIADGAPIGEVADILELASGPFLVIRPPAGREVLVPIVTAFLDEVDVAAGEVRLRLPEGFLEI